MKADLKKLLILAFIFLFAISMTACDMASDTETGSDLPDSNDIEVAVEESESEDMGIFDEIRRSELKFNLEDIEDGYLTFATDSEEIYPEETEFTGGSAEVEEMYTNAADDKLLVAVEDTSGNQVHEFSVELDSVSAEKDAQALVSTQDTSQVRGFFVDHGYSETFDEWIYFSDYMIYDEFDFYRQFDLLLYLRDHPVNSYYVDEPNNRYGTWDEYKVEGLDGLSEVEDFVEFYKEAEPHHHHEQGILIYRDAEEGEFRSSVENKIYLIEEANIEGGKEYFDVEAGRDLSGGFELNQIGNEPLDLEAVRKMAKIRYNIGDEDAEEIQDFETEVVVHVLKRVDGHDDDHIDSPFYLEGEDIEKGTFDFEIDSLAPNEYHVVFEHGVVLLDNDGHFLGYIDISHSYVDFEARPIAQVLDEDGEHKEWQPSINKAIDAADSGDGVKIYDKHHREDVEIIDEDDLHIFGEGEEETKPLIDGSVTVEDSGDIDIENLTIENDGSESTIEIIKDSADIGLNDNHIVGHGHIGVYIGDQTEDVKIKDNQIQHSGEGVMLDNADDVDIRENNIKDNHIGILIENSDIGNINENTVTNNWGGIAVISSEIETINDNTSKNHEADGIFVRESEVGEINKNTSKNNHHGIFVRSESKVAEINNNTLIKNRDTGLYARESKLEKIEDNEFAGGNDPAVVIEMDFNENELTFINNDIIDFMAGAIFENTAEEKIEENKLEIVGNNIDVQEFYVDDVELIEPDGEISKMHLLFVPGIENLGDIESESNNEFTPEADPHEEILLEFKEEDETFTLDADMIGVIDDE